MQYTFSLSRRSLPVRCLCIILIAVVLWCFFMVPQAGAVVAESAAVAYAGVFVGSVLVAAGVYFANSGDMARAGAAMYKTLQKGNEAIASKIAAISVWAVEHGKSIGSAALRIGKDLYQGIVDAFNTICSNGSITVPGAPDGAVSFSDNDKLSDYMVNSNLRPPFYFYYNDYNSDGGFVPFLFYVNLILNSDGLVAQVSRGAPKDQPLDLVTYNYPFDSAPVSYMMTFGSSGFRNRLSVNVLLKNGNYTGWYEITSDLPLASNDRPVAVSASVRIPVSGDLTYPSDDYLVKMPDIPSVDSATGEVTYPSDLAYTKDAVAVPYPVDSEGVKVPDIPYDKVVDKSTGKTLDDTDTGTDTPSKPGEGTDTSTNLLDKIIQLLKNFFDSPSDFKLDFDGFKNLILPDRFPFCIPFDMVKAVKLFAAAAADFVFSIDLDTQYFSVHHTVDLKPYTVAIAFFRYGCVFWFVWILLSRTRDLMKW